MSVKKYIRRRILEHLGDNVKIGHLPLKYRRNESKETIDVCLDAESASLNINQILDLKNDDVISKVTKKGDTVVFSVGNKLIVEDCFLRREKEPKVKNILVEFSSPNIAKPFHFGHLRSTITGNFVANIISKYDRVKKINYLGDWGTQVGFVKLGLKDSPMPSNPIKSMYEAYVDAHKDPQSIIKAREIFSKLENNDEKENQEWDKIKIQAVQHLEETYKTLGINFDEYSFESNYKSDATAHIFDKMLENKLAFLQDGQMGMYFNENFVPLLRQDGTSLYLSRDIGAALDRLNRYKCDKILYVVDKSQFNHLENLKHAIKTISNADIVEHIPFGKIVGMSTRKGTSIFLQDVLDSVCQKMSEQQEKSINTRCKNFETTRTLGLSCLFIYILKHGRLRDFKFNWDSALQGSGDSGVKLQYTHSRLCRLKETFNNLLTEECNHLILNEEIAIELILLLSEFDDLLLDTKSSLESSFLVQYLFKLCNLTAKALKSLPVKNQVQDVACQRMLLFEKSREVINESMNTLGITPLTEM